MNLYDLSKDELIKMIPLMKEDIEKRCKKKYDGIIIDSLKEESQIIRCGLCESFSIYYFYYLCKLNIYSSHSEIIDGDWPESKSECHYCRNVYYCVKHISEFTKINNLNACKNCVKNFV